MDIVDEIAALLDTFPPDRPTLVAIDGADASGKSTFADNLAAASRIRSRPVVRIEADDFEHPRSYRYRQGSDSPIGCLEDTYDHDSLERRVLVPLVSGNRRVVQGIYDRERDAAVNPPEEDVAIDAVVIVDGCFLLRTQLRMYWTLGIYLEVAEEERLNRAASRDAKRLGGAEGVLARYRKRYLPAFDLYLERDDPIAHADVIVDNNDVDHPVVLRWPPD